MVIFIPKQLQTTYMHSRHKHTAEVQLKFSVILNTSFIY